MMQWDEYLEAEGLTCSGKDGQYSLVEKVDPDFTGHLLAMCSSRLISHRLHMWYDFLKVDLGIDGYGIGR